MMMALMRVMLNLVLIAVVVTNVIYDNLLAIVAVTPVVALIVNARAP